MTIATFTAEFHEEESQRVVSLYVHWDFDDSAFTEYEVEEVLDKSTDEYLDDDSNEFKDYVKSIESKIVDFLCNEGEEIARNSGKIVSAYDADEHGDYLYTLRKEES